MGIEEKTCTECSASDWTKMLEDDYPEHRSERDRTVKTVYRCNECGAEGKHFEHNDGGVDTMSGALRQ